MSYHYSDPTRENDPHALPDVEVFEALTVEVICSECDWGFVTFDPGGGTPWAICPQCARDIRCRDFHKPLGLRYWFAFGFPGCLWDSEPEGPFETENEAIAAAREGCDDDRVHWNKGDHLEIRQHASEPNKGLTYPGCTIIASEGGFSGGWDVFDGVSEDGAELSFYGFSVVGIDKA